MDKIINFLQENWIWILPIIYEIVARIKPTGKDWSLVNFIIKIIDYVITNKKSDGEKHVKKKDLKKLLIFLPLLFVLFSNDESFAQQALVGRALWLYQTGDSTAWGANIPDGAVWQNSVTGKLRGKENGVVYDLIDTAGGGGGAFWPLRGDFSTIGNQTVTLGGSIIVTIPDLNQFSIDPLNTSDAAFSVLRNGSNYSVGIGETTQGDFLIFDTQNQFGQGAGMQFFNVGTIGSVQGVIYNQHPSAPTSFTLSDKNYSDTNLRGVSLPAITGQAGNSIRLNAGETAWEYYTPGGGSSLDSTNFWRTKSDFEIFDTRTAEYTSLIFHGGGNSGAFRVNSDTLGGTHEKVGFLQINDNNVQLINNDVNASNQNVGFYAANDTVTIGSAENAGQQSFGTNINFDLSDIDIIVFGDTGFEGEQYASDYSANYTDRSQPDKEYVDSYFTGSLTDGAPTDAELDGILGAPSAQKQGRNYNIKDTDGTSLIYWVNTDGTNWYYMAGVLAANSFLVPEGLPKYSPIIKPILYSYILGCILAAIILVYVYKKRALI